MKGKHLARTARGLAEESRRGSHDAHCRLVAVADSYALGRLDRAAVPQHSEEVLELCHAFASARVRHAPLYAKLEQRLRDAVPLLTAGQFCGLLHALSMVRHAWSPRGFAVVQRAIDDTEFTTAQLTTIVWALLRSQRGGAGEDDNAGTPTPTPAHTDAPDPAGCDDSGGGARTTLTRAADVDVNIPCVAREDYDALLARVYDGHLVESRNAPQLWAAGATPWGTPDEFGKLLTLCPERLISPRLRRWMAAWVERSAAAMLRLHTGGAAADHAAAVHLLHFMGRLRVDVASARDGTAAGLAAAVVLAGSADTLSAVEATRLLETFAAFRWGAGGGVPASLPPTADDVDAIPTDDIRTAAAVLYRRVLDVGGADLCHRVAKAAAELALPLAAGGDAHDASASTDTRVLLAKAAEVVASRPWVYSDILRRVVAGRGTPADTDGDASREAARRVVLEAQFLASAYEAATVEARACAAVGRAVPSADAPPPVLTRTAVRVVESLALIAPRYRYDRDVYPRLAATARRIFGVWSDAITRAADAREGHPERPACAPKAVPTVLWAAATLPGGRALSEDALTRLVLPTAEMAGVGGDQAIPSPSTGKAKSKHGKGKAKPKTEEGGERSDAGVSSAEDADTKATRPSATASSSGSTFRYTVDELRTIARACRALGAPTLAVQAFAFTDRRPVPLPDVGDGAATLVGPTDLTRAPSARDVRGRTDDRSGACVPNGTLAQLCRAVVESRRDARVRGWDPPQHLLPDRCATTSRKFVQTVKAISRDVARRASQLTTADAVHCAAAFPGSAAVLAAAVGQHELAARDVGVLLYALVRQLHEIPASISLPTQQPSAPDRAQGAQGPVEEQTRRLADAVAAGPTAIANAARRGPLGAREGAVALWYFALCGVRAGTQALPAAMVRGAAEAVLGKPVGRVVAPHSHRGSAVDPAVVIPVAHAVVISRTGRDVFAASAEGSSSGTAAPVPSSPMLALERRLAEFFPLCRGGEGSVDCADAAPDPRSNDPWRGGIVTFCEMYLGLDHPGLGNAVDAPSASRAPTLDHLTPAGPNEGSGIAGLDDDVACGDTTTTTTAGRTQPGAAVISPPAALALLYAWALLEEGTGMVADAHTFARDWRFTLVKMRARLRTRRREAHDENGSTRGGAHTSTTATPVDTDNAAPRLAVERGCLTALVSRGVAAADSPPTAALVWNVVERVLGGDAVAPGVRAAAHRAVARAIEAGDPGTKRFWVWVERYLFRAVLPSAMQVEILSPWLLPKLREALRTPVGCHAVAVLLRYAAAAPWWHVLGRGGESGSSATPRGRGSGGPPARNPPHLQLHHERDRYCCVPRPLLFGGTSAGGPRDHVDAFHVDAARLLAVMYPVCDGAGERGGVFAGGARPRLTSAAAGFLEACVVQAGSLLADARIGGTLPKPLLLQITAACDMAMAGRRGVWVPWRGVHQAARGIIDAAAPGVELEACEAAAALAVYERAGGGNTLTLHLLREAAVAAPPPPVDAG